MSDRKTSWWMRGLRLAPEPSRDCEALRRELADTREQLAAAQADNAQLERRLEEAGAELLANEKELLAAKQELEACIATIAKIDARIAKHEQRIAGLEAQTWAALAKISGGPS